MTQETMTISELISEGKRLDEQIKKLMEENDRLIGYYLKSEPMIGQYTLEEFENKIKSRFDRLNALVTRREAIGRARVQANSSTIVKVPKFISPNEAIMTNKLESNVPAEVEEITIAQAIWRKKWYTENLTKVTKFFNKAIKDAYYEKSTFDQKSKKLIDDLMKNKFKEGVNYSMEAYDKAYESMKNKFLTDRCDPLDLVGNNKAENYAAAVTEYIGKINAILSKANASTEITFEY